MIKFFLIILFLITFNSFSNAEENLNGDYSITNPVLDECNFMGKAKLNINYKHIKVKALQWKWNDTSNAKKKSFKGKLEKNYRDFSLSAKEIGSAHTLKGQVLENKITMIFSSTHEEANKRYGGCSFEFIKD